MDLPPCEFGATCYRTNPKHFAQFSHPWGEEGSYSAIEAPKRKGQSAESPKPRKKRKEEEEDEACSSCSSCSCSSSVAVSSSSLSPRSSPSSPSSSSSSSSSSSVSPSSSSLPASVSCSCSASVLEISEEESEIHHERRSPARGFEAEPPEAAELEDDDQTEKDEAAEDDDDDDTLIVQPRPEVKEVKEAKVELKTEAHAILPLRDSLHEPEWKAALAKEMSLPYFKKIEEFVANERKSYTCWPPQNEVFEALNLTPLSKVKIVIIGQDPYFNQGQGHGLSFSVRKGVKIPPSLLRMYKECQANYPDFKIPKHGFLQEWAQRGVLLLNATLTVRQGLANSHKGCGWQKFTDAVIRIINEKLKGVVFLLWGGFAQKKGKLIDNAKHTVLKGAHPSPLGGSAWHGNGHFKLANEALVKGGREPVDWNITP